MSLIEHPDWIDDLEPPQARAVATAIEEYLLLDSLQDYAPYPKQGVFHAAGRKYRNRLLRSGNQLGKTFSGAHEVAMHLTGEYPDWWRGYRFTGPIIAWATGDAGDSVRDTTQRLLIGEPNRWGTGAIPARCLTPMMSKARGVTGLLDYIRIKSRFGGTSMLRFRYYKQERTTWQGPPVDLIWYDEEPPEDMYAEGQARTIKTRGITIITYTPVKGRTQVTQKYIVEKIRPSTYHDTLMTIDDAGHMTPEKIKEEKERWPEHEWPARLYGQPMQGEGLIYPVSESDIVVPPREIPDYWPQLGALDFGWTHPTAAVRIVHDRDNDIVYVVAEYRLAKTQTDQHVINLKPWGAHLKWSWPHDGEQVNDRGYGIATSQIYRNAGLKMMPRHSGYPHREADGSSRLSRTSVERGIQDILDRMRNGTFKVFSNCAMWLEERRLYHRKDNKIVKQEDDLMDATRVAIMSLRHAAIPKPPARPVRRRAQLAGGLA